MILQFPRRMIPGIRPPLDEMIQQDWDKEFQLTINAITVMTSRPNRVKKILAVIARLDRESWVDV